MNEILSAVPIIVSLIIIEGLLSVDNALAIATMASGLPGDQKKKALRYGIVGAYVMRGLCLLFASWIVANPWIKAIGAGYLIYLMIHQLWSKEKESDPILKIPQGFWLTVVNIELMDLSLSLDNVVAAVALDRRLWVVWTGVFIGILALRFVAGFCIKIVETHPVLKTTAFLLVGYVGVLLLSELALDYLNTGLHIPSYIKFAGIFLITISSLIYEKTQNLKVRT